MGKKKVLLTNFNILNYSGSEIDTVTIANHFVKLGYDVDIFTLEYGLPLSDIVNKKVRVIIPNEIKKLQDKYDLIWAHHYPLLDYLIFQLKIKAKHIIYISLSSFEPLETLPFYYMDLSIIGALSEEAIEVLKCQMPRQRDILVFPNYATKNYFDYKIKKVQKIKKVCIISNHVPEELYDFKKIAESNSIVVDIYGIGNIVKYVDDKLLSDYDVIISIGKTIYYSLAMGKLSYCYDRFGGYGFVTKENIDKCFKKNFSGRDFGRKMNGEEIYKDIISNYKNANKELKKVKEFAGEKFDFEKNIRDVLKLLNNNNIVNCDDIIEKFPMLITKSKLYVESMNCKNNIIRNNREEFYREYENMKIKMIKANKRIQETSKEIESIYSSTSWKVSYPIRLIKNVIYKSLRKLKNNYYKCSFIYEKKQNKVADN